MSRRQRKREQGGKAPNKDEQGELCRPKNISHLYEQIRTSRGRKGCDETLPIEKALKGITDKQRLIVTEYYITETTGTG